ncbi:hypothetical protein ACO22_08106 [Paracoccidioides brasiliensis]|uniref:Uncharacterized protein n=1 Tax=Paracoccidioides brasiliensis TaxID=121759 RepID=A0A1D2J2S6_PARBR|nr:hypothetical protein ACO22_08106 [Paracoccidioides brasiliensis]
MQVDNGPLRAVNEQLRMNSYEQHEEKREQQLDDIDGQSTFRWNARFDRRIQAKKETKLRI